MVNGKAFGLVMVMLIVFPDLEIGPWVIPVQLETAVAVAGKVEVIVGIKVIVGVKVIVGIGVLVGVELGVAVPANT